jgi:hypothetical protein
MSATMTAPTEAATPDASESQKSLDPFEDLRQRRLVELGEEVRIECAAIDHALEDTVEHAIRAGEHLIAAKDDLRHGEWGKWLATYFVNKDGKPRSSTTAEAYMRLARLDDRERVAGMSLRRALDEIAEPKNSTKRRATKRRKAADDEAEPEPEPDDPWSERRTALICAALDELVNGDLVSRVVDRAVELASPDERSRMEQDRGWLIGKTQERIDRIFASA